MGEHYGKKICDEAAPQVWTSDEYGDEVLTDWAEALVGRLETVTSGERDDEDGSRVIVSYGPDGYLALSPDTVILGGRHVDAARITGHLRRRNGGRQSALRQLLRAHGIEVR